MRGIVLKPENPNGAFVEALPDPELTGPDQVLVKVLACGVNHADVQPAFGRVRGSLPRITGMDIAGEVVAVGDEVARWSGGEQVLVDPNLSCGACRDCDNEDEVRCRKFGMLGMSADGGHAELIAVPARNLHALPRSLTPVEGAAIPIAFTAAWHILQSRARLTGKETILITGASGALGHAAVQIARLAGCRTFALTSTEWKAREIKALGAHRAFLTEDEAWPRALMRSTGRRGVDLIFDPIGPEDREDFLDLLAPGGRYVSCGTLGGPMMRVDLDRLQRREISILGAAPGGTRKELARVLALLSLGKLKAVVDRRLPFERADEAYSLLNTRGIFGKIVLTP